jgi:hypothetical protein
LKALHVEWDDNGEVKEDLDVFALKGKNRTENFGYFKYRECKKKRKIRIKMI